MPYLYLVTAGILFGGVVFGAKILSMMGATLFEVMFYPNFLAALVVSWAARRDFKRILHMPWKITAVFLVSVTVVTIGEYAPLFLSIPVTLVVLLMYLQPVWTILIERLFFNIKQSKTDWALVVAMLIGLVFLINPLEDTSFSMTGLLMALFGGIGLSVWIVVTRYFSIKGISPAGTFWAASIYSALPVLVFYLFAAQFSTDIPSLQMRFTMTDKLWLAFIGYTLVICVLPNLLVFANNKDVSASAIGMILLLEPVTGIALDVLFLDVHLTWNIILGGTIIIIANVILIKHKKGRKKKTLHK